MVSIIIRREYLERVKKKSFIFTTILMPILMLGLMVLPTLIMTMTEPDLRNIVVVDETGQIYAQLKSEANIHYSESEVGKSVDSLLGDEDVDAVLVIPGNVMDGNGMMKLYNKNASSLTMETQITSQVNDIVEQHKLSTYDIDNLSAILDAVKSDVTLQNIRADEDGATSESSTGLSYILGILLTFMLYILILLYGQMVMTSIIEEKNNRVLELIVSSVSPTKLMLGKICGIGLVAVTQIVLWGVLLALASVFVMPMVMSPQITADLAAIQSAGVDPAALSTDIDLLQALALLGDPMYIINLFGLLLLFLIGGFMLYAAIYAAIGSAVDNIQDASQLQSLTIAPIILGIIFGMSAGADPSSTIAVWTSIIPFTSPMVMMARVPFGIPAWEIILSIVLLYITFFVMVWIAAKIYRVGIFMYGKKPTVKELVKWVKYK